MLSLSVFLRSAVVDGLTVCTVFNLPGFQFDYITNDLMHTVDLGYAQLLLGSIMFELFREFGGLVTKPKGALNDLLALILQSSRILKIEPPFRTLTIGMIKGSLF